MHGFFVKDWVKLFGISRAAALRTQQLSLSYRLVELKAMAELWRPSEMFEAFPRSRFCTIGCLRPTDISKSKCSKLRHSIEGLQRCVVYRSASNKRALLVVREHVAASWALRVASRLSLRIDSVPHMRPFASSFVDRHCTIVQFDGSIGHLICWDALRFVPSLVGRDRRDRRRV